MNCMNWGNRVDAYVDAELRSTDVAAFRTHAEKCATCSASALAVTESKVAIRRAGNRYTAPPELRSRVFALVKSKELANHQARPLRHEQRMPWRRLGHLTSAAWPRWAFAAAALLLVGLGLFMAASQRQESSALAEFVDLHVADLASACPVEVVSTDRHTVKPWFQGKIPFTFDLPELQGSSFTLVGGRVAYFHQEPGAQLLFRYQRHLISVFIFRQTAQLALPSSSFADQTSSFRLYAWTHGDLHYVVIGDANAGVIQQLSDRLRDVQ
jgi:anti-sigma factor RsiW